MDGFSSRGIYACNSFRQGCLYKAENQTRVNRVEYVFVLTNMKTFAILQNG